MPPPRALFSLAERRLGACRIPDLIVRLPSGEALSGPRLLHEIRRTASLLAQAGVGRDSRVLVVLSHPLLLALALPAIWSLDGIPLLADGASREAEVLEMRRRLLPDYLLGNGERKPGPARLLDLPPFPSLWVRRLRPLGRLNLPRGTVLVRTTSGSTGPPRGVALGVSQILADARNILSTLSPPAKMRGLAVVSLSHAFGFSALLTPLLFHARPILLLEDPVPEQFRIALGKFPSFFFPGVPYLFDLLARSGVPGGALKRLRLCVSAGAPLPPETVRRFRERSGRGVLNLYGTSECGAVSCECSPGRKGVSGRAGLPLSGVRLTFGKVAGEAPGLPISEPEAGRVIVEGEAVALGYVAAGRRPALFRKRYPTEDLGRIDSRGRLHLLGRLDLLISVGGRKVYPAEVERVLRRSPGVKEAVVLGIPDESRGTAVGAAVEAPAGADPGDLLARCRRSLARHKVPRRIRVLPSLPRTPRGKPDLGRIGALLRGAGVPPRVR